MKVKILKHKGFRQLVVQDKEMNELYGCSQENPILLATITNFATTNFWKVKDFRLAKNANGNASPYFSDESIQKYIPLNEEDSQNLKSKLTHYIEKDGMIHWSTKDGIVTSGDQTNNPDLPVYLKEIGEGAWSFKEAQKKLSEIKNYWESYNEKDLNNIAIPHPERQIDLVDYNIMSNKTKNKMR